MDDLGITNARKQVLADTVVWIREAYKKGLEWDCYVYASSITDTYEQLWLWLQLTDAPGIRSAIKRFQIAERKYDAEHQRHGSVEVPEGE